MPVFKRIKYALYLLIATTMTLMLGLGIGEGLGFIRDFDVQRLMLNPLYWLPVYAIGFALAPMLSDRMPISGDQPAPGSGVRPPIGYTVRVALLAVAGFALAMLASFVVFMLGRFA